MERQKKDPSNVRDWASQVGGRTERRDPGKRYID